MFSMQTAYIEAYIEYESSQRIKSQPLPKSLYQASKDCLQCLARSYATVARVSASIQISQLLSNLTIKEGCLSLNDSHHY